MLDGGTYLRAVKQPNDVGNIFLLGSFRKYIFYWITTPSFWSYKGIDCCPLCHKLFVNVKSFMCTI